MCRLIIILGLICFSDKAHTQQSEDSFSIGELRKHISLLTADSLKGRPNYSPEQRQVAEYLALQFRLAGLTPFIDSSVFFCPFKVISGDKFDDSILYNVIGYLPGKTRKEEFIIFSAHYDHIRGYGKQRDTIFNGANDNASGTTAVLMLAKYFALRNDNERSILFCLFAGEELGLRGSRAFVRQLDLKAIKAVVNIEMIGATNSVGKDAFFITGAEHSTMQEIFRNNLRESDVKVKGKKVYSQLYFRSDNYPFAEHRIPAHSFMASDDNDPCYHEPCDDLERLDLENMLRLIRAIAKGSLTMISGEDTPTFKE